MAFLGDDDIKSLRYYLLGFVAGILNGFFGAGGGLIVVPMLESAKLSPQKAHASSVAIILPLSIISGIMYIINGVSIDTFTLFITTPFGVAGAFLGAYLLTKLDDRLLRKLFALVMITSSIRLLLR